MNLSNLSIGEVFKNYKELCHTLGEKIKTGNAKKAQLKEMERYFKYSKQGNKFIIEEIYSHPKPKQDLRKQGNNTSVYIEDIEELILDLLGQERNKGKLLLSRSKLLKELKMINENYTYYRNRKPALSKFMDMHIEEVNDFYESSNTTFKSNLETALNRLERQALIDWNYALTVCYIDTHIQTTVTGHVKAIKRKHINEDGEITFTYDTVKPIQELAYRKATENERRIIKEIEKDTLDKYGCKDIGQVFAKGKIDEYYETVKDELFDRTNIVFYYKSYEILFNDRHIQERLEEIRMEEVRKYVTEDMLNKSIMNKLSDKAKVRHENAKDEYIQIGFGEDKENDERLLARMDKKYIINNDKLSDTLINKRKEFLLIKNN